MEQVNTPRICNIIFVNFFGSPFPPLINNNKKNKEILIKAELEDKLVIVSYEVQF